ncbi:BTAD domain-containing putative transcriptional regulator [uncultured Devosia sp.]|uniref:AfsR/SARP family transcriptional regulator n=1 Tax=uncultured Devosia sp. TaxID=211434 RepID=UPI00260A2687|nr:BTAD domain-containing putative transcriptional regulator [uncultured Devosia sp.]
MGTQAPHQITVKLLGTCCLIADGTLVQGVPASFFRIAAYLILSTPDQVQPRSRLAALLWPNAEDGKAGANLRQAVARIRHLQDQQGFRLIEASVSTLHLAPGPEVYCDLIEMIRHISGDVTYSPHALCKIYGGELLADQGSSSSEFEDWLSSRRDELLLQAVDGIAEGIHADGQYTQNERSACARRLLELDPYREDAVRVLMAEAAERRHFVRVSELYASMRSVLADDLGVEPSPETRALYTSLMEAVR